MINMLFDIFFDGLTSYGIEIRISVFEKASHHPDIQSRKQYLISHKEILRFDQS